MDISIFYIIGVTILFGLLAWLCCHMETSKRRIILTLLESLDELEKWKTISGLESDEDITPEMAKIHWDFIKIENSMLRQRLIEKGESTITPEMVKTYSDFIKRDQQLLKQIKD